jgi:hypothetical protein
MATAPRDGNRVGAIIQSMFARIKKLWVRAERESSDAESVAQPHARQAERQLRYANRGYWKAARPASRPGSVACLVQDDTRPLAEVSVS